MYKSVYRKTKTKSVTIAISKTTRPVSNLVRVRNRNQNQNNCLITFDAQLKTTLCDSGRSKYKTTQFKPIVEP